MQISKLICLTSYIAGVLNNGCPPLVEMAELAILCIEKIFHHFGSEKLWSSGQLSGSQTPLFLTTELKR